MSHQLYNLFGRNADVDTGTVPEDVWNVGGAYPFPSAAAATTIVSGSAEDDPDKGAGVPGTGAHSVFIEGVDANFEWACETIALNGAAAVTCVNQYLRVNRVVVASVGTNLTNVGIIDVKHGATVLARIAAGEGINQSAVFSVPDQGRFTKGRLLNWYNSVALAAGTILTVALDHYLSSRGWITLASLNQPNTAPPYTQSFDGGLVLPGGSDLRVRAVGISADNSDVRAGFDVLLE